MNSNDIKTTTKSVKLTRVIVDEEDEELNFGSKVFKTIKKTPSPPVEEVEFDVDEDEEDEDAEYERMKKEQEEQERVARERKEKMAKIERRRQYKNKIDELRENEVSRLEEISCKNDKKIADLVRERDLLNQKIDELDAKNEEISNEVISVKNGERDDDIIEEAMKKEPVKKVAKKVAKKATIENDVEEDWSDTMSNAGKKERVNRGRHQDWVRYFGSDTKIRIIQGKKSYEGLIKIYKNPSGSYNVDRCRVENDEELTYQKWRAKATKNETAGFYGDEITQSEFATPNDWLEAVGIVNNFYKNKRSVWVNCEFFDRRVNDWVSLKNYAVGEKVIN